jgi:AcrR family transcriptional regulator
VVFALAVNGMNVCVDIGDFNCQGLDARTKLILAAERLFGERGIDAVPLREVVAAAGQRNASALNYHIGGRDELIIAILEFRRAGVNARRMELLDQYGRDGLEIDEAAIAGAIVLPLAELMMGDPRGGNYLRFLSQAIITERPDSAYRSPGQNEDGMRRCFRFYEARQVNVAPRLVRERFAVCVRGVFYALADWHRDTTKQRSRIARSELPGFARELIAIVAHGLAATGGAGLKPTLQSTVRESKQP